MKDNTRRFSNRVENYVKYRPSYPRALLEYLCGEFGMNGDSTVADVGSGTGIFTGLLADTVKTVYAVEPNAEMRSAAERQLAGKKAFVSVDGTAENTTLQPASVDFIASAQAFHWFDPEKTGLEFRRILRKDGFVFLVWNKRRIDTDFLRDYERIVSSTIPEYKEVNHHNVTEDVLKAFLTGQYRVTRFDYRQTFTWEGVWGRLNSSSYAPLPGTEEYSLLEMRLRETFEANSRNGQIAFNYDTEVYSGKIL